LKHFRHEQGSHPKRARKQGGKPHDSRAVGSIAFNCENPKQQEIINVRNDLSALRKK
jgi:hypothetical protein